MVYKNKRYGSNIYQSIFFWYTWPSLHPNDIKYHMALNTISSVVSYKKKITIDEKKIKLYRHNKI
jgi:hypothetical protein